MMVDSCDYHYRRRIVMTEPPSKEAVGDDDECWVRWKTEHPGHDYWTGEPVRRWWGDEDVTYVPIAWCHRLPGETHPPQWFVDWKPDEESNKC